MRRTFAILAAIFLVGSLAGSTLARGPTDRVNRVVGNFDILDWDGSLVGHVVVNYQEPTAQRWMPGSLDVTWVPDARFPYPQPPFGAKRSHTILVAAWFGPGPGDPGAVETGISGSMCDFGAEWNATCHDFQVVIEQGADPHGQHLIAFGMPDWESNPAEWYIIGPGAFAVTYAGETGS
jgi:hypothetical protein